MEQAAHQARPPLRLLRQPLTRAVPMVTAETPAACLPRPRPGSTLPREECLPLPEDQARAIEAGFDGHLAKPPDLDRLDAILGGLQQGVRSA